MLQSDLYDYSNSYIIVKGTITAQTEKNRVIDGCNRSIILKNSAPFTNSVSKINNVLINNAEDLDIVMPMYNLIEKSENYSKTSVTLWNYYKDISTDPITNSESFKYKASITRKTVNDKNTGFSVPLMHVSNFWRTLDIPLKEHSKTGNKLCFFF